MGLLMIVSGFETAAGVRGLNKTKKFVKTTFGTIEIGLKTCRSRLTLDSASFLNDKLIGRRFDEHVSKNVHVCMDS